MNRKLLLLISSTVVLILLIPLVAMQFTSEVEWGALDFLIAFVLLFGAIYSLIYSIRLLKQKKIIGFAFLAALLFIIFLWLELAVGIFGSPFSGN